MERQMSNVQVYATDAKILISIA